MDYFLFLFFVDFVIVRVGPGYFIYVAFRRALNALTDRNKTKILIFFASFVKNKDKTTTTKKHNTTKKKQTNKQKKLQRITAVKHYFKKTKS